MYGNHKFFLFFIIFLYSFNCFGELIEGKSADFQILDKITSKIKNLEIYVDNSESYGTLIIKVFACYKRPPEEIPENFVLIKIYDNIENSENKIFQGWMISSSPSASPFEHPIYDIWLKDCNID